MSASWQLTLPCTRAVAEALGDDHPLLTGIDPFPALVASEIDEAAGRWQVDAYFEERPPRRVIRILARAAGIGEDALPRAKPVGDADWVTLSQAGLEPIRAGRFYVHTAGDAPSDDPGVTSLLINASQAFGTGHHATTAGCLSTLDRLHRAGRRYRTIIDVGTGTGLLAFAALTLWPRAYAMASDIDPVSIHVTAENAAENGVSLGTGAGQLALVVADGTDHAAIGAGAPYDLIIANILAGPLITLAPALAAISPPGGTVILAGLLAAQRARVIHAYRLAGFMLIDDEGDAEWPVLILRRRQQLGWRRPLRSNGRGGLPPGDYGSW